MKKPSLLYASPFAPMKSGISDYSEELVEELQKKFELTLYIDDYQLANRTLQNICHIVRHGRDRVDFDSYDYKIYNMGNNPEYHAYIYEACLKYPGVVILHDLVLYYLFVGYYQEKGGLYSKTYSDEGMDAFLKLKRAVKKDGPRLLEQKHMSAELPMNHELFRSQNRFIVHSQYTYDKILKTGLVEKDRIRKINQFMKMDETLVSKKDLFEKYRIPLDARIVTSMGNIGHTKLNHIVCQAVKKYVRETGDKVCYVMVGEGDYADEYVDGKVVIKTGYTLEEEFNSFIEYSDIIFNLRNPSMGETSRTMLQIMRKGKNSVINEGGWFSEIPDNCVIKISLDNIVEQIQEILRDFLHNPERFVRMQDRAKEYMAQEYSTTRIAKEIKEFICGK